MKNKYKLKRRINKSYKIKIYNKNDKQNKRRRIGKTKIKNIKNRNKIIINKKIKSKLTN